MTFFFVFFLSLTKKDVLRTAPLLLRDFEGVETEVRRYTSFSVNGVVLFQDKVFNSYCEATFKTCISSGSE